MAKPGEKKVDVEEAIKDLYDILIEANLAARTTVFGPEQKRISEILTDLRNKHFKKED